MKIYFAISMVLAVSVCSLAADKPRVFVTDSKSWEISGGVGGTQDAFGGASKGGARPQTAEIIKTFGERCPSVIVNNKQEKADYVILLEGTNDDDPATATFTPYEFRCKPGDVTRRPCVVAPYQYRIDWQMWFAAMSDYRRHPWIVHLVYQLLSGNDDIVGLLAANPFPARPPKWIRADLYRYRFATPAERSGAWWSRERIGSYLPPLSADDPRMLDFLDRHGWL